MNGKRMVNDWIKVEKLPRSDNSLDNNAKLRCFYRSNKEASQS